MIAYDYGCPCIRQPEFFFFFSFFVSLKIRQPELFLGKCIEAHMFIEKYIDVHIVFFFFGEY